MMKKRVLVFCDFYLPSLGGGGGMWAVANIVDRLCDRYEFLIVAGNRNARGSTEEVAGVERGVWNRIGNADVFYVEEAKRNVAMLQKLFAEARPDVVFLNSVFSISTIRYLQARARNAIAKVPTIIAPCGELLPGALAIKAWKKRLYLAYARLKGLYEGLIWRASFESEVEAIRSVFGREPEIMIAADLTPRAILPAFGASEKPCKTAGTARITFLSRISRKKNLLFLLERLLELQDVSIDLEIIGPIEDAGYWAECAQLIDKMPPRIAVTVTGAVNNTAALERLVAAHFFALPTLSENFGYVCIEALAAGCPLLISDRTDWGWATDAGAGWEIPLENPAAWTRAISRCAKMDNVEYLQMSAKAREIAVRWLANPEIEKATAGLFEFALSRPEMGHQ